jgi:lipopolysaccharide export LptBFGC system permease protein LptF
VDSVISDLVMFFALSVLATLIFDHMLGRRYTPYALTVTMGVGLVIFINQKVQFDESLGSYRVTLGTIVSVIVVALVAGAGFTLKRRLVG